MDAKTGRNYCARGWILYLAYTKAAPTVRERHRDEYSLHLNTCKKCRSALKANANTPDNPDVTIEQIMTITDLSKPL